MAFSWYQKSVENGNIIGQYYLGYCYEYGIGIEKDEKKSIYWYEEAFKNGNIDAKLYYADCYRLGKGVKKNEIKHLNIMKLLMLNFNLEIVFIVESEQK